MQIVLNKSFFKRTPILKGKFIIITVAGLLLLSLLVALIQLALPLNYSQQIVILNYHRVSDKLTNPWDAAETVTPQQFRNHLLFLKQHGFHVLALDDALKILQNRQKAILPNSIVITFDDGDRTYAENALPILKEFQYPSTEFIIGEFSLSSKGDYLSWPEISELAKDPLITFHSHTFNSHSTLEAQGKTYFETDPIYILGKSRMESDSEYTQRILNDSKQEQALFMKYLGRSDTVIALPYGHAARSFISLAQSSGYTYFLTQDRSQANRYNVDLTHIYRIDVGNGITDAKRLSLLMKGLTSSGPLHTFSWLRVKYNQVRFNLSPQF
ncbi:polysaccharide deacetylase family protein [Desulfosporosinus sp. SB140]|uniref:polysaccharide deacetylase family protein n=1 Tax=Desulfosporosinus paludis TaxID=3115649 RepID=UPI00388F9CCB